ncbi:hypothetical protein B0H17DRAFT_1217013 [Mycena rosella]|uniref:Uncharacterized protein n=1 Tax=Mycena rosella TaxID=1033263 RepID=A0AAD7FT27_MYCRO|nr:hypothetical protein B0H17DRAFT_1217013 [Mycena rosella]
MWSKPLDIWVNLDIQYLRGQLSVEDVVGFVVSKAHMCSRLTMYAADDPAVTALTEALRRVQLPLLRRLQFFSGSAGLSPWRVIQNQLVPSAFLSNAPPPTHLRLDGFTLPWGRADYFSHVAILVLRFFVGSTAPKIWELYRILGAAKALSRLSAFDVQCEGSCVGLPQLQLENLRELHLCMSANLNEGLGELVSRIKAPNLETFDFAVDVEDDLTLLLACPDLIANVQNLTIEGFFASASNIQRLYPLMPRVSRLDIAASSNNFFIAMGDSDATLWPN